MTGGTDLRIAGATGHRPRNLPRASLPWLVQQTRAYAVWLRDRHNVVVGVSGMADGFDLIWADAVVRAGMRLWPAIPFVEQPTRFPDPADRAEWARLRALAEPGREKIFGKLDGLTGRDRGNRINQLLYARNVGIIQISDYLVCCWDPARTTHCGTFNAITEAHRHGFPTDHALHIDPVAREIRMRLPALAPV